MKKPLFLLLIAAVLFSTLFLGCNAYIENTIGIYNSITDADIENALNKQNEIRATALTYP